MTIDERCGRWAAGLAEERRKDREEYQALWRDTQQKFDALGALTPQFAQESRAAGERLGTRIEEVDRSLQARIDSLVPGSANSYQRWRSSNGRKAVHNPPQ